MSSARQFAIAAIAAVDKGRHVQAALEDTGLEGADRKFCSDLVYGVLRARIRLRHLLGRVLPNPQKLPPLMRIALEMAAYSLFCQERAVDYAVVNETVKLVKRRFGQRMSQVANGALRSLQCLRLDAPQEAADIREWALYYAVPESIAGLWEKAYGRENAVFLMRRSFGRPYAALRVNLANRDGPGLLEAMAREQGAERVGRSGVAFPPGMFPQKIMGRDQGFLEKRGVISRQAAGSQLVLEKLGIFEAWRGIPVWDACAGFGGKALALLENGVNVLLATDKAVARIRHLLPRCARLGLPRPVVAAADAARPPVVKWHGHILADVPCSGLGVLARRPDIKPRFTQEMLARLADMQKGVLYGLSKCLQPGRELVYITCTLNPSENEERMGEFLKMNQDMEMLAQWQTPHSHDWLEGMYGCRLRLT